MNKKKKQQKTPKTPKQLPDFSISDIINTPASKPIAGLGCTYCGSTHYISKGIVKVFRGQRMVVHHCHGCGQDFYKEEK